MRLDSSGNLGIGVTPSAFSLSGFKSLEVGGVGSGVFAGTGDVNILVNAYYNSGWKYSGSGEAIRYQMNSAQHRWYTSTSGTAGNPITFTQAMTLDSSGNLLVGSTSQSITTAKAYVTAIGANSNVIHAHSDASWACFVGSVTQTSSELAYWYYNGDYVGKIATNGTSVSYASASDYRLKDDYQPVATPIDRLNQLKPINFVWKSNGIREDGFIAHELQEVIPEAATGTKDEVDADGNPVYQGIDQSKIVPLLTAALQEAVARIESLTERIAALEYTKQGE